MSNKDWLDRQAEREKNARLYGENPPRSGWLRALLSIVAWTLGTVIALAVLVALAGLLLASYGTDEYVLDCRGSISERDGTLAGHAGMHVAMREYGRIIKLWSDDAGTAQIEIPGDFYEVATLKPVGTLISITTFGKLPGHYSPLSRSITLRLTRDREFVGQCARRANP
jgi:hypothetical protein